MEEYALGAIESRFADMVWEEAPLSTAELVKICEEELGWKRTTTYTVLKKLSERGIVRNEERTVTSLVSREVVLAKESQQVVQRSFQGSLPLFLTAFLGGQKLSASEADELKKLIDAHKKEG